MAMILNLPIIAERTHTLENGFNFALLREGGESSQESFSTAKAVTA